jgi:ParB family chromosome partitioning protein
MAQPYTPSKSLGRGLAAILGPDLDEQVLSPDAILSLDIHQISPGKFQPRRYFDEENLDSLVASIKEKGVIQPIIVRTHPEDASRYEIVAGERRWRSAQKAGLDKIPAIFKKLTDSEALETALIENIQRHDLNALEEAEGYLRLIQEFSYTQEDLGKIIGKSRSHIANTLRLMELPEGVKHFLREGKLSAGHARALVNQNNAEGLAEKIIRQGLNVRQVEKLVQAPAKKTVSDSSNRSLEDDEQSHLKDMVSKLFGLKTELMFKNSKAGKVVIHFNTIEELDQLLEKCAHSH